ncbi:MAG: hypothetical protein CSA62_01725 [Planctomycetota bacterium]|nr:MAG: hypothetical protein CSA62_01725 [Planctomycetota bacterium]
MPFAFRTRELAALIAVLASLSSVLAQESLADRIKALSAAKSSADQRRRAKDIAKDSHGRLLLTRLAETTRSSRLQAAIFAALASRADKSGLRYLKHLTEGAPASRRAAILRALRLSPHDAKGLYSSFVAPNLGRNEEALVLIEALRLLARKKDLRFFEHCKKHIENPSLNYHRPEFFRLACSFDDLRAITLLVPVVEKRLLHAEESFLRYAVAMRAPGVSRWMRAQGLRHFDAIIRRSALRQIQRTLAPADLPKLEKASRDEDPEVAFDAVRSISRMQGKAACAALLRIIDGRSPRASAQALRELFARKDGRSSALDICASTVASYRPAELRIAAMDILEEGHARAFETELQAAGKDPDSRVRIAAYHALAFLRENRSIEFLIDRLAVEEGSPRFFLLEALRSLTGHDQGDDPDSWFTWWELAKKSYVIPLKKPKHPQRKIPIRGRSTSQYYGISIFAKRMAFIIDLSGSMSVKVKGKDGKIRTRLAQAKIELIQALRNLPNNSWFNIVPFDYKPKPWRSKMQRASKQNIAKAVEFVQSLRAGGSTNIYDALELCLDLEDIESIFLLSDGGPSIGKFVVKPVIRSEVRIRNQLRRIRLHTIMIGGSNKDRSFMRRLAEENYGRNVNI